MLQAVIRKVHICRQLRTTSSTIRRPGKRFNVNDVTNDSTRTDVPVLLLTAEIGPVTSNLPSDMPAVVTARNTPGTHNNSATGPFSETGVCCGG